MALINSKNNLIEYIKRTQRQKEVLQLSMMFDAVEKEQISQCFDDLIQICERRLAKQESEDKQTLDSKT